MAPRDWRILVVDDQRTMADTLAEGLSELGYQATATSDAAEAAQRIRAREHDALVTDLRMPGVDGLELLALAREVSPERPVIVMTAFSAVDSAVESIRRGAYHYLTKPFKVAELALFLERALEEATLRREAERARQELRQRYALTNLVGESPAMREVYEVISRVADTDVPILLLGETGAGKSLVARTLHAESLRSHGPFVSVNCASLPEPLLESELFGHVKGAFTGATQARTGLFAEAEGGTLFLDEVAEMVPALQAKLLDVLERRFVRPVGSSKERAIDVRVIAATHRDLRKRVTEGAFREDLLYRLEVVTLEVPPLRHRPEDLPALLDHFVERTRARYPRSVLERFSPEALAQILDYPWPGNVRELEHLVERVALLARTPEAGLADLPATLREPAAVRAPEAIFGSRVIPLRDLQRQYVRWAFEKMGGRKGVTGEALGIDAKTLARYLADVNGD